MKQSSFLWVVLLAVLLAAPAGSPAAQAPDLWPGVCDTIDVVASRPDLMDRLGGARGFVTEIPLGSEAPATADLGEMIERAAGVQIRRYGGIGSPSFASVRGSSPAEVRVFIDDIPLSNAVDGMANLALLPARLFESVEIGRGPLADRNGGGPGAIRLRTPDRFDEPIRLRAAAGSFGTRQFAGTAGAVRGPFSFFAAGGSLRSDGDYPYLDRGATPFEKSDDRIVRRRNNAFRQDDLLVRVRAVAGTGRSIDYTGQVLRKEGGIPGTETLQTRHVRDSFRRWIQGISLSETRRATYWRLAASAQSDRDHFENPDGEVGLGRADRRSRLDSRGVEAVAGAMSRGSTLGARIFAGYRAEDWTERDRLALADRPGARRRGGNGGIEASLRTGPLEWMPLVNWTAISDRAGDRENDRTLTHRRIGIALRESGDWSVRGGWGIAHRIPTFVEMFGQGGVQAGNPDLTPERGESWDLGFRYARPAGSIEAVYFGSRTRDAIVWVQNSQRTSLPLNLERTRIDGAEITARCAASADPGVDIVAAATLQDARDDGPSPVYHGKRLPYLPQVQGSLRTELALGRMTAAHTVDWEGSAYRDRYNSVERRRGPRILQDLDLTVRLGRSRYEAVLLIRNITDRRSQDVAGFPVPGRSVLLSITADLGRVLAH